MTHLRILIDQIGNFHQELAKTGLLVEGVADSRDEFDVGTASPHQIHPTIKQYPLVEYPGGLENQRLPVSSKLLEVD
jgi:hypothetical protein